MPRRNSASSFLQVAQDRLAYLYALHVVGGGVAVDLADVDASVVSDRAVQEAHVARASGIVPASRVPFEARRRRSDEAERLRRGCPRS